VGRGRHLRRRRAGLRRGAAFDQRLIVVTTSAIVSSPELYAAWQARTPAAVERVRNGVWSVPVPVPGNPIRYTLSYLLVGDDGGVVVVDPGWESDEGEGALFAGMRLAGVVPADIRGIVATHIHPDHHGLSRRLLDAAPHAWIGMSHAEALTLEQLRQTPEQRLASERAWWTAAGSDPSDPAIDPSGAVGERTHMFEAMPAPTLLLDDGDPLPLPGRSMRVIATPGHTPGHICLLDEDDDLILTGDHLLPRISPNVGLQPTASGSPLRQFLRSLELLTAYDHEALPGHQWRFRAVPARARELVEHHRIRLAEVLARLGNTPMTASALAPALSWAHGWEELGPFQRRAAVAETISHLVYLVEEGRLTAEGFAPVVYSAR
jgi:glyoxylase-like metal-dependent hydrolase (beta-lactamase superfamily II)